MYIYKAEAEINDRGKGCGRILKLGLFDSLEKAQLAIKASVEEEGFDPTMLSWKANKVTVLKQNDDGSVNRSYVWSVKRLLVK